MVPWSAPTRRAADQREVPAGLGPIDEEGREVRRDRVEAARWYRLAEAQGNADARSAAITVGPSRCRVAPYEFRDVDPVVPRETEQHCAGPAQPRGRPLRNAVQSVDEALDGHRTRTSMRSGPGRYSPT